MSDKGNTTKVVSGCDNYFFVDPEQK